MTKLKQARPISSGDWTPARGLARAKVRRMNSTVLDRGQARRARMDAERDLRDRLRYAREAGGS